MSMPDAADSNGYSVHSMPMSPPALSSYQSDSDDDFQPFGAFSPVSGKSDNVNNNNFAVTQTSEFADTIHIGDKHEDVAHGERSKDDFADFSGFNTWSSDDSGGQTGGWADFSTVKMVSESIENTVNGEHGFSHDDVDHSAANISKSSQPSSPIPSPCSLPSSDPVPAESHISSGETDANQENVSKVSFRPSSTCHKHSSSLSVLIPDGDELIRTRSFAPDADYSRVTCESVQSGDGDGIHDNSNNTGPDKSPVTELVSHSQSTEVTLTAQVTGDEDAAATGITHGSDGGGDDDDDWGDGDDGFVEFASAEPSATTAAPDPEFGFEKALSVFEKLSSVIHLSFPSEVVESDDDADTALFQLRPTDKTWSSLTFFEKTPALQFRWNESDLNKLFMSSLKIDSRNVMPRLPAFATDLVSGRGLLEPARPASLVPSSAAPSSSSGSGGPTPTPSTSITTITTTTNAAPTATATASALPSQTCMTGQASSDSETSVQFDWNSSGLSNPLTLSQDSPDSLPAMDLDFFELKPPGAAALSAVGGGASTDAHPRDDSMDLGELEPAGGTAVRPTDPRLDHLLESISQTLQTKAEHLSEDCVRIARELPDLDYMVAGALMFPLKNTPSLSEVSSLSDTSLPS